MGVITDDAQELWIPGPLPGQNEMLNAHGFGGGGAGNRYARLKRKWTEDVALLAKAVARLRPVRRAWLTFLWRERDRRRNPDNVAAAKKLVIDGLVVARVLKNDGWSEIAGWTDEFEVADRPGVLVRIKPVD